MANNRDHANQQASQASKMPEGEQVTNSFAPPSFSLTAAPAQQKEANAPVQLAAGDLKALMDDLLTSCPNIGPAFMDVIHNATLAERQAILNDQRYIDAINDSIGGDLATTVISALMEGSQKWQNPTANDFFTFFVRNGGNGPLPNTATMNCWESIMYAAFLAGQIDAEFIRDFYNKAVASPNPNTEIWKQLGFHQGLPQYPDTTPVMGQFIFYFPTGSTDPSHIALSQGGDVATSLWNQPNNVDSLQRIQINDLASRGGKIFIGNPAW